jgi:hypothetical protein
MLRIPGIILLCLCVLAMPSYAAITCGSACEVSSDSHEHQCCPTTAASTDDHDAPSDSPHHGKHHCAAPCCGYVATVLIVDAAGADAQPLADLLPTAAVLTGSVDHDAIFHPPRP